MTKHQKIDGLPNLDRRSFIIGTAATGLVFGYAALPEIKDCIGSHLPPMSSRPSGTRSATTAKWW